MRHSPIFRLARQVPVATLLLSGLLAALAGPAPAKVYVVPHVLESSGKISDTQFTFDTNIVVAYEPGPGAPGASVDLYLYNNQGTPLTNSGVVVCNPCTETLNAAKRKATFSVDDLITSSGLPFDAGVKLGYGIIVVGGAEPDNVAIQGFVVNAHTGPFDLSTFAFEPPVIQSDNPCTGGARVFVLPHVLEVSGKITNTQYTFDTTIFATYTSGQAGIPGSGGANVDLYLYGEDSQLLRNNGNVVCNPCGYNLGAGTRKGTINIDDLILAQGAFDTPVKLGYGVIVVSGADPDGVNLQGFVVNSHTSPFDLSVFGFDPVPLQGAARIDVPNDRTGMARGLTSQPNPARGGMSFAFEMAEPGDIELSIFDPAGRKVATVESGRREAGAQTVAWDGRDATGQKVPPGVYFGRLSGADGSLVSKLVMVP